MAKFTMELPQEIMKDFDKVYNNSEKIFGGMTKAGAEVAYSNIRSNVPNSFRSSNIMNCMKITKVFKTPSDGGINTQVGFYGYLLMKMAKELQHHWWLICLNMEALNANILSIHS